MDWERLRVKLRCCFILGKERRKRYRMERLCSREYNRLHRLYHVGENTYAINPKIKNPSSRIGKFCSIADGVLIGTSSHPIDRFTTHPLTYTSDEFGLFGTIVTPLENIVEFPTVRSTPPCIIENDVWIGTRAIIMDGVHIGSGAIVAAGAIVTKDVPPYAIVAGVPARIIRYRFTESIIKNLLDVRWWDFPEEVIAHELAGRSVEFVIDWCMNHIGMRKDCNE